MKKIFLVLFILVLVCFAPAAAQQPARDLTFQWTDPNEPDQVTEFVLYYGQNQAGPYDMGSIAILRADCTEIEGGDLQNIVTTDSQIVLQAGQIYDLYFIMTAKNAGGLESEQSNECYVLIDLRDLLGPQNLGVMIRIVPQ